ncbi:pyridoxamine 5'-phosphate oxidase [Haematococcus lacustris]
MATTSDITYLSAAEAAAIDAELMGPLGFSLDQLMELAGLSVAAALQQQYPLPGFRRVLVLAGPGNNGGDGLVAARHLSHAGYEVKFLDRSSQALLEVVVAVLYPSAAKAVAHPLFSRLQTQLKALEVPLITDWQQLMAGGPLREQADLVVDALFGFSFSGTPRPPYDLILKALTPPAHPPPVLSVDVPSGWDVDAGDLTGGGVRPHTLVSLTAPKGCARHFQGVAHFLGGRFVPPALRQRFSLQLPPFPGSSQVVRLSGDPPAALPAPQADPKTPAAATPSSGPAVGDGAVERTAAQVADMRISYTRGGLMEADMQQYAANPMDAWALWFAQAVEGKVCEEPNAISVASVDPSSGQPSVRVVLLKGFDARGFVFYTNYNSRKGQELLSTGKAAFTVYWEALQRQVRVEGTVEQVSREESGAYFHSRPRGSQVGAWVSQQSQPISSREALEQRAAELEQQFSDESQPVPLPPHWGGLLIRPTMIEFWQGRPSRLHDRIRFSKPVGDAAAQWQMERLQP